MIGFPPGARGNDKLFL